MFDVVVAGAGPVGLAFAAFLAGAGLRVALVDPQAEAALADPADDGREIAWLRRSLHAVVRDLPGVAVLPGLSAAAVRSQGGGTTAPCPTAKC